MSFKSRGHKLYAGVMVFISMFTLSLSIVLAPFAKAEDAPLYTWRDITIPGQGDISESRVSPDGSKLFVLRRDLASGSVNLLVSANDGASWSTFAAPEGANGLLVSSDGSKLVVKGKYGENAIYVSTDGGRTWVKRNSSVPYTARVLMSSDGSTLVMYWEHSFYTDPMAISTDDGNTWVPKGDEYPDYVFNGGKMARRSNDGTLRQSTDYGMTWSTIGSSAGRVSFSSDGKSVFDGFRTSIDGGANWNQLPEYPIDTIRTTELSGISNDGKKLFVTFKNDSIDDPSLPVFVSSDGGKTWQKWGDEGVSFSSVSMSADGSRVFATSQFTDPDYKSVYRLAILPRPQPVTPGGTGTGGTTTPSTPTTPSTGSASSGASVTASSSASSKKPGKSSNLAETGVSVWVVGGVAVIAVAAGGLVLRKRL
ncbi:WD40/YVTN/BNR-like repeat-containing protein [Candidatus Nanosynbacter sp. TM7-053]|uniref:WD40/YVTN/BNR-like repeat-containing protein n=1 Tax=Candidatus Nanosynbacter sp. TM7-053 TaxID=2902634 RepID=UPI001FB661CC|nr:sialidase family protein [Candidatus Nanosynbacter sp. TM7-053]MCJ1965865.1 glycoside hydrolase [Candidatus Nanosynbacter sp. TM7-053]